MTAAFWWYVLAGFMVGFCVSTAWEWLYFRQRRMRITDRRIAELQQALSLQARAAPTVEVLPQADVTWSATEYRSPGVFMENEATSAPAPEGVASMLPAGAAVAYGATTAQDSHVGNGLAHIDAADKPPWSTTASAQRAAAEPGGQESSPGEHGADFAKAVVTTAAVTAALAPEEDLGATNAPAPVEADYASDVSMTPGAVGAPSAPAAVPDERSADLAKAAAAMATVAAVLAPEEDHPDHSVAVAPAPSVEKSTIDVTTEDHEDHTVAVAPAPVAEESTSDVMTATPHGVADVADAPAAASTERAGDLAKAAVATAAVAAALASDEESTDASVPAPVAEEHPNAVTAPAHMAPPQVTTEVRGFSARPGYIVSELSPGEFAAVQSTQKARLAAKRAWQQVRTVTDYLRNV